MISNFFKLVWGKMILNKLLQPSKAETGIDSTGPRIVIDSKLVQPEKMLSPKVLTDCGIVSSESKWQFAKQDFPRDFTLSGIEIVVSFSHP